MGEDMEQVMDRYDIEIDDFDRRLIYEKKQNGEWVKYEDVPKWISVKDELPDENEIVLAYNVATGTNTAVYNENRGTNGFTLLHWGMSCGNWFPHITHWQRLPDSPASAGHTKEVK